jgi:hypothetical protein
MTERLYRLYKDYFGNDYDSDPNDDNRDYYNDNENDDDNDNENDNDDVIHYRNPDDTSYTQLLQLSIPNNDTSCLVVDKSVDRKVFYIYIPPTGKEYLFPIDPTRTFRMLLHYIIYSTEEFNNYYLQSIQLEFVLEKLIDCDEEYTSETFLDIPLDKIPLAQGKIIVKKNV